MSIDKRELLKSKFNFTNLAQKSFVSSVSRLFSEILVTPTKCLKESLIVHFSLRVRSMEPMCKQVDSLPATKILSAFYTTLNNSAACCDRARQISEI